MIIDLHIHSKTCSDGNLSIEDIFKEAQKRGVEMMAVTDHDSLDCQAQAIELAKKYGIRYITGMELNIIFSHPELTGGKDISLDFLAYQYDIANSALKSKLKVVSSYREERALKVLEKINIAFDEDGIDKFTPKDIEAIQASVDGVFGRPHIANYMVKLGIVVDKQEAFDRYLVKCDVPKYPFRIEDVSKLVHDAGGILVLAHPDDPNGTSMVKLSTNVAEQTKIIEKAFLANIDGIECWHTRHSPETSAHYIEFARANDLIMTGGSDCHQKPLIMGTVDVPDFVASQFDEIIRSG
jgi:predicted metal-dependent phosphoesterase TrpH